MSVLDNFPAPDYFDGIFARVNNDMMWDVVGRLDGKVVSIIMPNVANKPLADAFIRWYTDGYWKQMFEGAQDC